MVWIASLARVGAAGDRLTALLTQEEQLRSSRFRNAVDRQRFTIGRALTRLAVASHLGCSAQQVGITIDDAGKPWLEPGRASLSFSIAHSGDLVVAALAARGAIGVDVESRGQTIDLEAVMPLACSVSESDTIRSLPTADRIHRFLVLWTLKEAFLKATGVGLAGNPAQVVFNLDDDRNPVLIAHPHSQGAAPPAPGWTFVLSPDVGGHVLALAFEAHDGDHNGIAPVLRDAGELLATSMGMQWP